MTKVDALVARVAKAHGRSISRLKRVATAEPFNGQEIIHSRHRLVARSEVSPELGVSLLLTFDIGYHASGWWRNSDYDRCWHASMMCVDITGDTYRMADADPLVLQVWSRAIFRDDVKFAWIEPPASKRDVYRNAPQSAYVTHVRVFVDRNTGRAIKPEGEVYQLKAWPEGDSPEKVFR